MFTGQGRRSCLGQLDTSIEFSFTTLKVHRMPDGLDIVTPPIFERVSGIFADTAISDFQPIPLYRVVPCHVAMCSDVYVSTVFSGR